jgi:hypothetical protein
MSETVWICLATSFLRSARLFLHFHCPFHVKHEGVYRELSQQDASIRRTQNACKEKNGVDVPALNPSFTRENDISIIAINLYFICYCIVAYKMVFLYCYFGVMDSERKKGCLCSVIRFCGRRHVLFIASARARQLTVLLQRTNASTLW